MNACVPDRFEKNSSRKSVPLKKIKEFEVLEKWMINKFFVN